MGNDDSCPVCQFRGWASRGCCKREPCVALLWGSLWGYRTRSKVLYLVQSLVTSHSGYTTCILTNSWLDDSTQRSRLAQLLCQLKPHFDFLIESCRIRMAKPDPQIYKFMLDTMKASPSEVCRHFLLVKKNILEILQIRDIEEEQAGGGQLGPGSLILSPVTGLHSLRPGLLKDFTCPFSPEHSTRGGHVAPLCGFYRSKQVLSKLLDQLPQFAYKET